MEKEHKVKKRRNTFLQGLGKILIGVVGIGAMMSALLCALCPLINPSSFVWFAFFGLAYWMIFFANVIILIILIALKSRRTLIVPILALLFLIPGFTKSYSFGEKKENVAQLKVMTYNVGVFRDYKDEHRTVAEVKNSLAELVKKHNPDIICLQESGKWPKNTARNFSKTIDYKYYTFNPNNGNSYFSKYPLSNAYEFNDERLKKFVDVKKIKIDNKRYFYLINCHFNSFGISREEIEYINDTKNIVNDSEVYAKSLIVKLKRGFERRTTTTELLLKNLPDNDVPFVICGDFNDTPLSYTYSRISKSGLKDAFITTSKGIGKTYCGSLPLLRIDYFWYNDKVEPIEYERVKQTTSDHYPLILTFNLKDDKIEEER